MQFIETCKRRQHIGVFWSRLPNYVAQLCSPIMQGGEKNCGWGRETEYGWGEANKNYEANRDKNEIIDFCFGLNFILK